VSTVRTRFAPSPTGRLHLGGARTALFNYLFARYHSGNLILRIEDTDKARSNIEFERDLLENLSWLGLSFDEGPYRQSERGALYERTAARLSERGLTYEATDKEGRRALYFQPPERAGSVRDALRGEIRFSKIGNFVLIKSDGTPSYNFAAVVDDLDMGVTFVIRGEEHLPNTARQALLYRALGAVEPEFIHLGLILGPDGRKLSKRHGAASVAEHRRDGYLPEALVNYLGLLGWTHPEGKEEFADLEELSRQWDPLRLGVSPAAFDLDRLLSVNARHIRRLPAEELRRRLEPFLTEPLPQGREVQTVEAVQEDMRLLSDAPRLVRDILGPVDPGVFAGELPESSDEVFTHTASALKRRPLDSLEEAQDLVGELRAWAGERGIKTRDLLHPLRLALTGRNRGPEMARLFVVLGTGESRERIERARDARLRA
jgi:glutamyl/glutaminyl-tRNA synthetase